MTRGDGDGGDGGDGGDVDECELDGVIARAFTSSDASTTGEATARLDAYKVRACLRACVRRTDGRTDGRRRDWCTDEDDDDGWRRCV